MIEIYLVGNLFVEMRRVSKVHADQSTKWPITIQQNCIPTAIFHLSERFQKGNL